MANSDEFYMQQALKEARKAYEQDEVPIGAVIVLKDKIISRAFNQVEKLNDSTAHAEILALTTAYNFLGSKYLPEATIYVTIEPCLMCAGALYWSQIGKLVYAADDPKHGAISPLSTRGEGHGVRLHPKTEVISGICKEEASALIKKFFKEKR